MSDSAAVKAKPLALSRASFWRTESSVRPKSNKSWLALIEDENPAEFREPEPPDPEPELEELRVS